MTRALTILRKEFTDTIRDKRTILMMVVISRREGPWQKKPAPSWTVELLGIALALAGAGVVVVIHPWITGMPVFW